MFWKKKHSYTFYVGSLFFISWFIAEIVLASVTNVGAGRLIRQAIIPFLGLLAIGLDLLLGSVINRFAQLAIVTVILTSFLPIYVAKINQKYAAHRYVRLNNDDMLTLQYIRHNITGSSKILTPVIYTPWLAVSATNSFNQAIIRPRIDSQTQRDFWSILDTSDPGLIEKYQIKYIYLGHPTPDVNYEDQNINDSVLLRTGHWIKLFQSGQVRLFQYSESSIQPSDQN